MDKTLPEIIADILTHSGAVIEQKGEDAMDLLVPPDVSKVLNIPEFTRLLFSYNETCNEAIHVSYDSDFLSSIAMLFTGKGKLSVGRYETSIPDIEKISRVISERIVFNNATFRLEKSEIKHVSYLLLYFKYIALSDERREGIIPVLINELNLSTTPFEHGIPELKEVAEEPKDIERHETKKVVQSACSASAHLVKEGLRDFITSLERRLNRDIKRVYDYYETLREETKKAIKRKALTNKPDDINSLSGLQDCNVSDPNRYGIQAIDETEQYLVERDNIIEKQIEDRTIKGDGVDKLLGKLDAIDAERKWKVHDLVAKYELRIQIEPISSVRIVTQSILSWIKIKRRLLSRQFPIAFNPIIRKIEALPCESCFSPQKPYYICDKELHIVCARCFGSCLNCSKKYCNACYDICPGCRKGKKIV